MEESTMAKDREHLFVRKNLDPVQRKGYLIAPTCVEQMDFEEYAPRFEKHFKLTRDDLGIMTAKWHTEDGPMVWGSDIHRAVWQLCKFVGQDESTECFILGGLGDKYIDGINLETDEEKHKGWLHYEHMYHDGPRICEALINDLAIPTIGVINGPGFHAEMALFCDITLMAEDAFIADMHYPVNLVPGDGIQICLQQIMGIKRANYLMLTGQTIDAKTALQIGMVNEVLPRDKIWARAQALAEMVVKCATRPTRHVTVQVLRKPWKEALAKDLWNAFGSEMFCSVISPVPEHDNKHWEAKQKATKKGESQVLLDTMDTSKFD
jgi:enoyl-CoA hydratase/carnithine racemase